MAKIKIVVPSAGESVTEVTLGKWLVQAGVGIKEGSPVVELDSDKASMEVPAPASGGVVILRKTGDTVKIGDVIGEIDTDVKVEAAPKAKTTVVAPPVAMPAGGARLSKENYLKPEVKAQPVATQLTTQVVKEQVERKPISKLRKTIAARLVQVKNETAMLTTFNEVDMSEVMRIRNREKDDFQKTHGVKLTFMPFFVKACAVALKKFPDVNAFIDGDEIVYHPHSHIGIAVSTENGLVVPILRQTDTLSFTGIAKTLNEISLKARDRKLSVADMSGGTFTITNGGVFGSMLSTPILNPPQSAILGMHNIVDRPVAIAGKVEIRPIMYLALSYDHRIIDGKEAITFLNTIKALLEDPAKFLLWE